MKQWEKEIKQAQLDYEKEVYQELKQSYSQALKDVQAKSKKLQEQIQKLVDAEPENETLVRSKIYQLKYQEAMRDQINEAMDMLKNSDSITTYMENMYKEGYVSQIYALQKQGIPLITPINHDKMLTALTYPTNGIPLSTRLYNNVEKAKKEIMSEISRGIASGMSGQDVARNIQNRMNVSYRKARQLAQNEGHRVNTQACLDSMHAAKEKGADIVKQWDCTYDKKTRPVHAELDQQWVEVDDYFDSSQGKVFAPKQFGIAALDINCRCALLSVPRWDVDDSVKKHYDNIKGEIIDAENYADWKEKYYNVSEKYDDVNHVLDKAIKTSEEHYNTLLTNLDIISKKTGNLKYNPVLDYDVAPMDENDIISSLSGGDLTQGSCASVALAYIGQKQGWNVLDFRGGESQYFFSSGMNLFELSLADGLKVLRADGKSSMTVANKLIKLCEESKEYYLSVGRHAAIVRKKDGILQYLELQSESKSGWTNFNGNPKYTLKTRFGCSSRSSFSAKFDFMIDIDDSDFSTDEFKSLLGYLNTAGDAQKKGQYGTIK